MITIVKPVVRSEKEVTIAEVLEERLIHELKLDKNAKSNAECILTLSLFKHVK